VMTRSVSVKKPLISYQEPLEPIRKFRTNTNYEDAYLMADAYGPDSNPNELLYDENSDENIVLNSRFGFSN